MPAPNEPIALAGGGLTFIDGEFIQPGPLAERAHQLAAMVDAYGLTIRQRRGFFDRIIEFAICDAAWEADDAAVTPETTTHPVALWAMAWRARSAAWMIRHRRILETALTRRS